MTKYVYIPVDEKDFFHSCRNTGAIELKSSKLYPYGKTRNDNLIICSCQQVMDLRDAIVNGNSKGTDVFRSCMEDLAKAVIEQYTDIGLEADETTNDYTLLIHFGGQDPNECRQVTEIMKRGCFYSGKAFKYVAVSRAYSFPPEYWKNGALVFPDERDRPALHSPDLNHLKSFYRQCRNLLSEPDYIDRFNDREFWCIVLWDGMQPKSFDKAFSESEISLLLDDENKEMKAFFESLVFPFPSVPDVIDPSVVRPALASATISVPSSATAFAPAAPPPLDAAFASAAASGFTVSTVRTVSGTAFIDAPAAYKIISQILRIFNPPNPVYVPPYSSIKFSCFSKAITVSCFALLCLILIVMPSFFRIIPEMAEYETECETRTPVLPVQGQESADDVQTPISSPGIIPIDQRTVSVEAKSQSPENGREKADNSCFMKKQSKKAAPIQYFHMFLLFSVYALGGILCFIICLRFLRIHSREQKILNQEHCFSNLGRFIFTLKPEDQDAIVKQFAQASIRLYFNGDDGE